VPLQPVTALEIVSTQAGRLHYPLFVFYLEGKDFSIFLIWRLNPMNTKQQQTVIVSDDNQAALHWLRQTLSAAFEVSPLTVSLKKRATSFVWRIPGWLLAAWARVFNVDYKHGFEVCPNLPEHLRSDTSRELLAQAFESERAVPTIRSLRQTVVTVLRLLRQGYLPADGEMIERGIAALALSRCTRTGCEFMTESGSILQDSPLPDCLLNKYRLALERGDGGKLKNIDAALKSSSYCGWIISRLREVKRWLSGYRELNIRWEIETLPDNGGIYEFLLKGGKNNGDKG